MNDRNARNTLSYRIGTSLAVGAWGLLAWMLWYLPLALLFRASPVVAIGGMVILTALFLRVYAFPGRGNARARARSRSRGVGRAWVWVLVTAPGLAGLALGMWCALLALGMAAPAELPEEAQKFMAQPGGELAFVLVAVAVGPLLEEFGFRGWIQGGLERRLGPSAAIACTAILFAVAHMDADYVPVRLAAGLVLGHAVYATRSVWAGVALHAAWNGGVLAVGAAFPKFDPTGEGWAWGGPAAGVALASLVWCAWGVRRMQDQAGRARPSAPAEARGRPVRSS